MRIGTQREPGRKFIDLDAWRYFRSCSPGKLRVLLVYGAIAAVQSLLVIPVLLLIRHAFDVEIPHGNTARLALIGVVILALRLVNSGVTLWLRMAVIRAVKEAVLHLRQDLLTRLYAISRTTYTRLDRNTTHAQIVQDTERLDNLSNQVVSRLLPAIVTSLALLVVLAFFNWVLLLVIVLLTPLLLITVRVTSGVVKRSVFAFQRAFEQFSRGVFFVLHHMDLTKIHSFEQAEVERRVAELEHLKSTSERMAFIYAVHGQIQGTVVTACGIVILVLGGGAVGTGRMSLGAFLSFWVAAGLLNGFVSTITASIPEIIGGNESMFTLHRLAHAGEPEPYRGTRRIAFKGRITFEDVRFAYDGQRVLNGVDLEILPGTSLGIVGPNGAGKSTILYLALGFYRPLEGRLLADGVPYDELDMAELRRSIGAVMQHPTFLPGTILDNIAYGSPRASKEDVLRASRLALADEFIQRLPDGYSTEVGDEGILLSGGEVQRIAIARALMRRPRVLILDEPTNHLESGIIDRLMTNLLTLEDGPSIVTISHDRATLSHTRQIYRLENGVIQIQPAIPDAPGRIAAPPGRPATS